MATFSYDQGKEIIHYLFSEIFTYQDLDLKEESNQSRVRRLSSVHTSNLTALPRDTQHQLSKDQVKFEKNFEKSFLYRIYSDPNLLKPILYSCILSLTNNLSGFDILSQILTLVIRNSFNLNRKMAQVMTVIITIVRLISASIGAGFSHKIDRKTCLLRLAIVSFMILILLMLHK